MSELGYRGSRVYLVARVGSTVVGYGRRDARRRRRPHHHARRRPGVAPAPARHAAAPRAGRRRHRPGRHEPDPRGPGEQRRGPGALPRVRLRARRDPQGLLRRDEGGRHRHVGQRRRQPRRTPSASRACPRPSPAPPSTKRSTDERPRPGRRILGIETSCDETAAAIVEAGTSVLSSVVSSQVDLHARYGGVVPEIASRAHVDLIVPVIAQAFVEAGLSDRPVDGEGCEIDAVAATYGPGLVGALLVGVSAAKALALAWDVPFIAVNHLEAHLYATLLEEPDLELPLVVLLVSGGHTLLVLMEGHGRLPGARLDHRRRRRRGLRQGRSLPRPRLSRRTGDRSAGRRGRPRGDPLPAPDGRRRTYDFSFSGLKTAVVNHVRKHPDVVDGRRGGVVPGGGRRRARRPRPGRRPARSAPRGSASAAAWRPTPGSGSSSSTPASRTGCAASSRAGPCAPTTPPWWPAPAWYRWQSDGPSPLDTGAHPNLRLAAARCVELTAGRF